MEAATLSEIIAQAKRTISQSTITPRYKLPMDPRDLYQVLSEAYRREVMKRHGKVIMGDDLIAAMSKMCRWITDPEIKSSILLYGNTGSGKTTLVRALASAIDSIKSAIKDRVNPGERSRDIERLATFPRLNIVTAQMIADAASSSSANFGINYETLSQYEKVTFLAIDDLGCEPAIVKSFGTEVTPITELLYSRYDSNNPTIVTTNMDCRMIRTKYGDRVADRFNEVFERIAFTNPSFRK